MSNLHFFVPSNRTNKHGRPTHVDGWNEYIKAVNTHRMVGANLERENVKLVSEYAMVAMRNQRFRPPVVPCEVHVTFVEVNQRRDVPNVFGGLKWVLDGLSRPRGSKYLGAGAIFDDSPKWVTVHPHIRIDPSNPGVEIDVIPIGG